MDARFRSRKTCSTNSTRVKSKRCGRSSTRQPSKRSFSGHDQRSASLKRNSIPYRRLSDKAVDRADQAWTGRSTSSSSTRSESCRIRDSPMPFIEADHPIRHDEAKCKVCLRATVGCILPAVGQTTKQVVGHRTVGLRNHACRRLRRSAGNLDVGYA